MTRKPRTDSATLEERLKQGKALTLRLQGLNYTEIAGALGYANRSGAWKAVRAVLKRNEADDSAMLRQIEGERLDAMLVGLWTAATTGDVPAVSAVLKISARRAALFGLDLPRLGYRPHDVDPEVDLLDDVSMFPAGLGL